MAVTAFAGNPGQTSAGLRPMDPARDLGTIAKLIEEAFADELDDRGRAALREMRWMSRLSPLVWWWSQADPGFRESFGGFVWEEPSSGGKRREIVGNVSLNRAPGARRKWVVCNVVVLDRYRRQGIGGRLTQAAVAEARELGAQTVILQVHKDNPTAFRLYARLGFVESAAETRLRLSEAQLAAARSLAPMAAPGYRLRAWRPEDGYQAIELARWVTPSVLQWLKPVRPQEYQLGWWDLGVQRLAGLLAGRRVYRLVASQAGKLVALMTVAAALRDGGQGRAHHLAFLVHPQHAEQVVPALVSRALFMLAAVPGRHVLVSVDSAHPKVLELLGQRGFKVQRTLLTLTKTLQ